MFNFIIKYLDIITREIHIREVNDFVMIRKIVDENLIFVVISFHHYNRQQILLKRLTNYKSQLSCKTGSVYQFFSLSYYSLIDWGEFISNNRHKSSLQNSLLKILQDFFHRKKTELFYYYRQFHLFYFVIVYIIKSFVLYFSGL